MARKKSARDIVREVVSKHRKKVRSGPGYVSRPFLEPLPERSYKKFKKAKVKKTN